VRDELALLFLKFAGEETRLQEKLNGAVQEETLKAADPENKEHSDTQKAVRKGEARGEER